MKCRNCGAEYEEGNLFCPKCGKEIQWVPEYNTLETLIRQKELQEQEKKKKEMEAQKERERLQKKAEQERKKKKKENDSGRDYGDSRDRSRSRAVFCVSDSASLL